MWVLLLLLHGYYSIPCEPVHGINFAASSAEINHPYPIASRPVASDRASPGVPQRHAWAGERTSERRAEDEGRAVAYAIVQHAGQRD